MGERITYSDLIEILDSYFTKDDLADLLERAELKKSGNKRELIERLLNESNYDLSYLLSMLYREELAEICENFSIPKKGSKQAMIEEILKRMDIQRKVEKTSKKLETAEINEIYSALKEFRPYKPKSEPELEKQLVQFLDGKGIKGVTPQKAGAHRGSIYVPDIVIGKTAAIEIKYFKEGHSKVKWDEAVGQAVRYKVYGDTEWVFILAYDESGAVPDGYKKYEELLPWLKIIIVKK